MTSDTNPTCPLGPSTRAPSQCRNAYSVVQQPVSASTGASNLVLSRTAFTTHLHSDPGQRRLPARRAHPVARGRRSRPTTDPATHRRGRWSSWKEVEYQMTLTRKDAAATALTILVVLAFLATHEGWGVPLIGDSHRWAAGAVLLLGMLTCGLGSPGRGGATRLLAILGVLALVLAALAGRFALTSPRRGPSSARARRGGAWRR